MNPSRPLASAPLRALLVAVSFVAGGAAQADPADDAERARLAQERAAIDARYAARVPECQQRFVVTSCVEDAKRDRRRGLDALKARQIALDEARRRERSEVRRSELSGKAAEEARRESARAARPSAAASAPRERPDDPAAVAESRRPPRERAGPSKSRASDPERRPSTDKPVGAGERAAKEGRSRATFEARQRQAVEHREEVNARARKRLQERPDAAPLPLPPNATVKPTP